MIKNVVGYMKSIRQRPNSTILSEFTFECKNEDNSNFCKFIETHNCKKQYLMLVTTELLTMKTTWIKLRMLNIKEIYEDFDFRTIIC